MSSLNNRLWHVSIIVVHTFLLYLILGPRFFVVSSRLLLLLFNANSMLIGSHQYLQRFQCHHLTHYHLCHQQLVAQCLWSLCKRQCNCLFNQITSCHPWDHSLSLLYSCQFLTLSCLQQLLQLLSIVLIVVTAGPGLCVIHPNKIPQLKKSCDQDLEKAVMMEM